MNVSANLSPTTDEGQFRIADYPRIRPCDAVHGNRASEWGFPLCRYDQGCHTGTVLSALLSFFSGFDDEPSTIISRVLI